MSSRVRDIWPLDKKRFATEMVLTQRLDIAKCQELIGDNKERRPSKTIIENQF